MLACLMLLTAFLLLEKSVEAEEHNEMKVCTPSHFAFHPSPSPSPFALHLHPLPFTWCLRLSFLHIPEAKRKMMRKAKKKFKRFASKTTADGERVMTAEDFPSPFALQPFTLHLFRTIFIYFFFSGGM